MHALIVSQEQFYRIWSEKEEDSSVFCGEREVDAYYQRGFFLTLMFCLQAQLAGLSTSVFSSDTSYVNHTTN